MPNSPCPAATSRTRSGSLGVAADQVGQQAGRESHQRRHRAGERHPDRVVVRDRALVGGRRPAPPHGRRQVAGSTPAASGRAGTPARPQVGGRLAVEEDRRVGGEFVAVALLAEEADDGEVVRQDADAARRRLARARRSRPPCRCPRGDVREQVQLDRRPQGVGALVGVDRVEEQGRVRGRRGGIGIPVDSAPTGRSGFDPRGADSVPRRSGSGARPKGAPSNRNAVRPPAIHHSTPSIRQLRPLPMPRKPTRSPGRRKSRSSARAAVSGSETVPMLPRYG